MKILFEHCPVLGYAVISPGKIADDVDPDLIGAWRYRHDALLLRIGIEEHDHTRIGRAAKEIRRAARHTGAGVLVINGFSHLSDPAARCPPDSARGILSDLAARLAAGPAALPLDLLPFGWTKQFQLTVAAGEWQQRVIHL